VKDKGPKKVFGRRLAQAEELCQKNLL